MGRPYRRRQFITDLSFQRRYILTFTMLCLTGMVASVVLFNWLAARELEAVKWRMIIESETLAQVVAPYLIYISLFGAILTTTAIVLIWRNQMARIVGPVFRLRKDLQRVCDGDLTVQIRLRGEDEFKSTAVELDRLVVSLRQRFSRVNDEFASAKRLADGLRDVKPALLALRCEQLRESVDVLGDSVKAIRP